MQYHGRTNRISEPKKYFIMGTKMKGKVLSRISMMVGSTTKKRHLKLTGKTCVASKWG
jgi:hypothetical protein